MLSLVCVRLFRKLGRYTLLVVKYAIIITIVSLTEGFSQLILPVFSKISGPMSWDLSTAAGYIVSAVIYGLVVLLLLRFARYMLERFDA